MDAACIGTAQGKHLALHHAVLHLHQSLPVGCTAQDTAHVGIAGHLAALIQSEVADEDRVLRAVVILVLGIGRHAVDEADEAYAVLAGVIDDQVTDDMELSVEAAIEGVALSAHDGIVVDALHVDVVSQSSLGSKVLLGGIICPPEQLLRSGYIVPSVLCSGYIIGIHVAAHCAEAIYILMRRICGRSGVGVHILHIAQRFSVAPVSARRLGIHLLVITRHEGIRDSICVDGLIIVPAAVDAAVERIGQCSARQVIALVIRDCSILLGCSCGGAAPAVDRLQRLRVAAEAVGIIAYTLYLAHHGHITHLDAVTGPSADASAVGCSLHANHLAGKDHVLHGEVAVGLAYDTTACGIACLGGLHGHITVDVAQLEGASP